MSNLPKRRVYVMDCGDFVKIGISFDVERRRKQIPYSVKQYYCTEPIANYFEVEKKAHNRFSNFRVHNAKGTEYFDVDFTRAYDYIRELTDKDYAKILEKRRRKKLMKRLKKTVLKLDADQQKYLCGLAYGMLLVKGDKVADSTKQLQEA